VHVVLLSRRARAPSLVGADGSPGPARSVPIHLARLVVLTELNLSEIMGSGCLVDSVDSFKSLNIFICQACKNENGHSLCFGGGVAKSAKRHGAAQPQTGVFPNQNARDLLCRQAQNQPISGKSPIHLAIPVLK